MNRKHIKLILPKLFSYNISISFSCMVVLMEWSYPIHDGLGPVDFIQIDQSTRTNPCKIVVLPIVVRNELQSKIFYNWFYYILLCSKNIDNFQNAKQFIYPGSSKSYFLFNSNIFTTINNLYTFKMYTGLCLRVGVYV